MNELNLFAFARKISLLLGAKLSLCKYLNFKTYFNKPIYFADAHKYGLLFSQKNTLINSVFFVCLNMLILLF